VVLGAALLGERLSTQMLIGIVLVIGSVVAVWRLDIEAGKGGRD
jgi:drug/metabolite transporter (DMT)-like permease